MTHQSTPEPRPVARAGTARGHRLRWISRFALGSLAVAAVATADAAAIRVSPPSEAVTASVSDRQAPPPEAHPVPVKGQGDPSGAISAGREPVPAPPPAASAVVSPGPGAAAAPLVELRRASEGFEAAAASKVSARDVPPGVDAEPAMPDFSGVARGAALGELHARFHEFQSNGWVVSGTAKVVGRDKVEAILVDGVPTHRVSSCVDSSGVVIRDISGVVILAASPAGTRTAINIYDIQQHNGKWLVVSHSFPDAAAC